jgi:heat shock protein HslJ
MNIYSKLIVILFLQAFLSCKSRTGNETTSPSSNNPTKETPSGEISPTDKYWKLVELRGVKVEYVNGQSQEMYLTLKEGDNILIGHGGCNTFSGKYMLKGPVSISFREIISTEMACPNMNNEAAFLQVLQQTDNYSMIGDTLFLHKARMAPLARLEAVYKK